MSLKKIVCVFVLGILANSVFSQNDQRPGCLDSLLTVTAFSPNGDEVNATFYIELPCAPEKFQITIFKENGQQIFSSTNYQFIWDGSDSEGDKIEAYTYHIELYYLNEKKVFERKIVAFR